MYDSTYLRKEIAKIRVELDEKSKGKINVFQRILLKTELLKLMIEYNKYIEKEE